MVKFSFFFEFEEYPGAASDPRALVGDSQWIFLSCDWMLATSPLFEFPIQVSWPSLVFFWEVHMFLLGLNSPFASRLGRPIGERHRHLSQHFGGCAPAETAQGAYRSWPKGWTTNGDQNLQRWGELPWIWCFCHGSYTGCDFAWTSSSITSWCRNQVPSWLTHCPIRYRHPQIVWQL